MTQTLVEINNPGNGSCAIYAFWFGAAHISVDFYDTWQKLYIPSRDTPQPALAELLNKVRKHSSLLELSADKELCVPLMWTLREIMYDQIEKKFPTATVNENYKIYDTTLPFVELEHLVEYYATENNTNCAPPEEIKCNLLRNNSLFEKLAKNIHLIATTSNLGIDQDNRKKLLIYLALKTYRRQFLAHYKDVVTLKHTWLADNHIRFLATIFNLPIQITKRTGSYGQGNYIQGNYDGEPFVHVVNINAIHWVTLLYDKDCKYSTEPTAAVTNQRQIQIKDKFETSADLCPDKDLYKLLYDKSQQLSCPYKIQNFYNYPFDSYKSYMAALERSYMAALERPDTATTIESWRLAVWEMVDSQNPTYLAGILQYHSTSNNHLYADIALLNDELLRTMSARKSNYLLNSAIGLLVGLVTCLIFPELVIVLACIHSIQIVAAKLLIIIISALLGLIVGMAAEYLDLNNDRIPGFGTDRGPRLSR